MKGCGVGGVGGDGGVLIGFVWHNLVIGLSKRGVIRGS